MNYQNQGPNYFPIPPEYLGQFESTEGTDGAPAQSGNESRSVEHARRAVAEAAITQGEGHGDRGRQAGTEQAAGTNLTINPGHPTGMAAEVNRKEGKKITDAEMARAAQIYTLWVRHYRDSALAGN